MATKPTRLQPRHYRLECSCGREMFCTAKKLILRLGNGVERIVKPSCNKCVPPRNQ